MERNLFWKLDVVLFYLLIGSVGVIFADDFSLRTEILVAAAQDPMANEESSILLESIKTETATQDSEVVVVAENQDVSADEVATENDENVSNTEIEVVATASNDLSDDDLAELERIGESVYAEDMTCDVIAEEEQDLMVSELSNLVADNRSLQESDNEKIYR